MDKEGSSSDILENVELPQLIQKGAIVALYTDNVSADYYMLSCTREQLKLHKNTTDYWGNTFPADSSVIKGFYFDKVNDDRFQYKLIKNKLAMVPSQADLSVIILTTNMAILKKAKTHILIISKHAHHRSNWVAHLELLKLCRNYWEGVGWSKVIFTWINVKKYLCVKFEFPVFICFKQTSAKIFFDSTIYRLVFMLETFFLITSKWTFCWYRRETYIGTNTVRNVCIK